MSYSIGKVRRLQQCATPDGKFVILAIDHRGNLRQSLNPAAPESVSYGEMVHFKQAVTAALAPAASAVLLDPEYGAAQAVAAQAIPGQKGLIVSLEETGYSGEPTARESAILPGWSVAKIARVGAAGVKVLVYYHPKAENAGRQEALVQEIATTCRAYDIPLFLEPLSFSLDPQVKTVPSAIKRDIVIETARRLTPLGIDILKAEFPLNMAEEKDEAAWHDACVELSQASRTPWVLLSAGVSFAEFKQQTLIACEAGASGVMVGRAVWKEAVTLRGASREEFLRTTARERMEEVAAVCVQYGRAWTDFYPNLADSVSEDWYKNYEAI
jgi:tagatose-1,6-bisphosphate aldolase